MGSVVRLPSNAYLDYGQPKKITVGDLDSYYSFRTTQSNSLFSLQSVKNIRVFNREESERFLTKLWLLRSGVCEWTEGRLRIPAEENCFGPEKEVWAKNLSDIGLLLTPTGVSEDACNWFQREKIMPAFVQKYFFVYFNTWDQSSGPSVAYVME